MKAINNIVLRIIFALALGVVLIVRPSEAINYLVVIIGFLFLILGSISIFRYFLDKQPEKGTFPADSIGSALLGLALILAPGFFIGALMYILAGVLVLAGFWQIRELYVVRKLVEIPFGFYIMPVIVLLIGLFIFFNPFAIIETTFIILGIACVIYSISELINYLKFLKKTN